MKVRIFLNLFALVGFFISLNGQDTLYSIQCHEDSFKVFIQKLEEITPLSYYYNPSDVDTLKISINKSHADINEILGQALNETNLFPSFINDSTVVFTPGFRIKTDFASQYRHRRKEKLSSIEDTIPYLVINGNEEDKHTNEEFILHKIGSPADATNSRFATVNGYLRSSQGGEPIIGAVVYSGKVQKGAITNPYGYYSLTIPKGEYTLEYRSIGFRTTTRMIQLFSDGSLNVEMKEKVNPLKEVTITANKDHNVQSVRIGMEKVDLKTLKIIPAGMGEADVIKSAQLLPGVQTVGEAAGGFNVRGGSSDQNLVLLDGAPILNTSHFFGFFSAFNPDMINDITLYKSAIPAKYGGRISSVMDISIKEGNRKNYKFSGGVNPAFLRFMAEGPMVRDKAAFALSLRTTYSDWILEMMQDARLKESSAGFYDVQGVLSYEINEKNSLYLSAYTSHDRFDHYQADAFSNSNLATTLKWKHTFNNKLMGIFSAVYSGYNYQLDARTDSVLMRRVIYNLDQYILKGDFIYYPHPDHKIEAGISSRLYNLMPGSQEPLSDKSIETSFDLESENALESAFYISDEFTISPAISIMGGLRFSLYNLIGPYTLYNYNEEIPRKESSILDTTKYNASELVKTYGSPEFRISTRIKTSFNSSVKLGFDQSVQYIHMISNTAAISPTDIWKLSDPYILPQKSKQLSGGYFINFWNNRLELSLEAYYKRMNNIIDYKDGARLIMNEFLEADLLNGKGKGYGVEFMIRKPFGRWSGWFTYSYSRIFHQVEGRFPGETVNSGDWFPANFDKPHDLKFVSNMKFSRRANASVTFIYNTGRPITYPVAFYEYRNTNRVYYSERNQFRIPDYARLDFALTFNGNMKEEKLNHGSLTFALYNVLGRKNPYSVFFRTEDGELRGYKMSIYGRPIFTLTYNFKIRGNASDDF